MTFDEFEKYLRENPMPTKTLDKNGYRVVERRNEELQE